MHASRFWFILPALVLTLLLTGCSAGKGKKDTAPAEGGGNPLIPNAAGGGAAGQGAVQRGAQKLVNENLMRNIGQAYSFFKSERGGPPRTQQELRDYLASDPNYRREVEALDKGWVVMVLNPPPSSNQVLAYEKEEFQGYHNRLVLFGDGHIQTMVNDDFQRALKGQ